MLENRPDCIHLGAAGHVLGTGHTLRDEFTAYVPSRPHPEWQLRKRVQDIDNVEIVRRSVAEPRFDRARQRVTGVLLDAPQHRQAPQGPQAPEPELVPADLVVDAAGRGTRLPVWLEQWGYRRPAEATIDIGINYATHRFRVPEGLIAEKVVVAGAAHDQSLGLGMLYYEDRTPVLSARQPLYDPAPTDNRPGHDAQHAAVAARAPAGRKGPERIGHNPTVALNSLAGSRATSRIGPSSAATQAAIPRSNMSDPDLACTVVQPLADNKICGPSWLHDASTSWPRYSPSSASSATANSSAGVS